MKKLVVIIAGTPGVGKTTVGRRVAKALDAEFIDVPELVRRGRLYEYYDRSLRTYVVDEKRLEEGVNEAITALGRGCVVVASHIIPKIKPIHDVRVVVIRLNPLSLIKRLERRGYPRRKIIANTEAEFIGVVYSEAVRLYGVDRVIQLDATGLNPADTVSKVLKTLKGLEGDHIDWLSSLSEHDIEKLIRFLSKK
ncbi:MAG TPA: AAA family ATPase [Candidatus Caldiarchaeum subterraneum]|uniref:Putative adenylate kinase n=1 Tax=Caldiarchaeum subterraneum TaxID=311458 RepID=A0A832ZWB7_CALS0|nr:AAA family ATPase [Candidatus Caldarchaeum subterraneum]